MYRKDPIVTHSNVFRDFTNVTLNPNEQGFDVALDLLTYVSTEEGSKIKPSATVGIDESYFTLSAYAISSSINNGSSYTHIPIHLCLEFEEKTGRRPFKSLSREKFEEKL